MAHPASCYTNVTTLGSHRWLSQPVVTTVTTLGSHRWLSQPVVTTVTTFRRLAPMAQPASCYTTVTTFRRLAPMAQPASCYNCNDVQAARTDGSASQLLHNCNNWLAEPSVRAECYNCNNTRLAPMAQPASCYTTVTTLGSHRWLSQPVVTQL